MVAAAVENGSGVSSDGLRPEPITSTTLPLSCGSTLRLTICETLCSAASRWFSRSAVLWPDAFSVMICWVSEQTVPNAPFSVARSARWRPARPAAGWCRRCSAR